MYESWFRFRRRPFAAAPRVDDYYPAESSETARKSLIGCVQRGAGPGLLIGATGSGKSTLCHQLLGHFRTRTAVATISCSGLAARRALFQNILFELGRPYRDLDEGELRLSLVDYLTSRDASHAGTVLLFDDAHYLSPELFEDLRMLCGMVRDGHWCVHVVLSGTVRLEEILGVPNLESLHQRIAVRCYLEPFGVDETIAYVRRQFERVGGNADKVFVEDALMAIHQCSGGTPRLINQLCDHALLLAATGSRSQLDEHGISEAWSDLQHLPPPENASETELTANEIVEFGSLDSDPATASDDAVIEVVANEESIVKGEEQQLMCPTGNEKPIVVETESMEREVATSHAQELDAAPRDDAEPLKLSDSERFGPAPVDTEIQLDMIDAHLDRYDDESRPASENPFLEDFAEEEIIVDHPISLLNRVVDCQPRVSSRQGQELSEALDGLSQSSVVGQPCQLANQVGERRLLLSPIDTVKLSNDAIRQDVMNHGYAMSDFVADDGKSMDKDAVFAGPSTAGEVCLQVLPATEAVCSSGMDDVPGVAVPEVDAEGEEAPEFAVTENDVAAEALDAMFPVSKTGRGVADVDAQEGEMVSEFGAAEFAASDNDTERYQRVVEIASPEVAVSEANVRCEEATSEVEIPAELAAEQDVEFEAVARRAFATDDFAPQETVSDNNDFCQVVHEDHESISQQIEIEIEDSTLVEEPEPQQAGYDLSQLRRASELPIYTDPTEILPSEVDLATRQSEQDQAAARWENSKLGADSDCAVEISNVIFELQTHGEPFESDSALSNRESGHVIEVYEVRANEFPAATSDESVGYDESESSPERVSEHSVEKALGNGNKPQIEKQPLPRDATAGRRLNRLFSNLADR